MYVRIYIYIYIVSGLKLTSLFLCLSYSQIYVQPSRNGHGKSLSLLRFSLWYLQMIGYIGRVRLVADYTISLSSLCRLIWRHWTTEMLVWYMLPSVCLRLRQFSQLSFVQYMVLLSSAYPILLWWSWQCVLYLIIIINRKYESLTIV